MFAHLTFKPKRSGQLLLVPRVAIIGSMQAAKVFVVSNNVALLRPVVAVREIGTRVAISSGIQAGDSVVVDGQNNLSDNAQVIVRQH
jgi:multidrug efflux pump subunit AcrA (membrane-fusion protein)